jgi:hypothetical protein
VAKKTGARSAPKKHQAQRLVPRKFFSVSLWLCVNPFFLRDFVRSRRPSAQTAIFFRVFFQGELASVTLLC